MPEVRVLMVRKREFLPRMGRIQTKKNIDGRIYRLRLIADKATADDQKLWYWKRKIDTLVIKTEKGYELWVNEK
jgi:hypothetical protein